MSRGLLILILVLFSGELTGLSTFLEAAIDQQVCVDDGPDCQCPPGCMCWCCSHAVPSLVPAPVLAALLPLNEKATAPDVEQAPPSTDPHDILHVPKLSLL